MLGIPRTADTGAIRKAYAARIKAMDLDRDVEGYAALRNARDVALRQVKAMADSAVDHERENELAPGTDGADARPGAAWPHGAPVIEAEAADGTISIAALAPGDTFAPISPARGEPGGATIEADKTFTATNPFAAPLLEGHDPARAAARASLASPFERLIALLAPGDAAARPLDSAAEAEAQRALQDVIAETHLSPIGRQDQLEAWLAGVLADSWPRSAPCLEDATRAFDWEREWGRRDARPAIEYLGARLRGYRFQQRVLQPDHRYYKAWIELSRPGKAGPLRFLRTNAADVRGLLAGVRKHFPELEDHLDAQRVTTWESGSSIPTAAIVLVGLLILAFLISLGDNRPPEAVSFPAPDPATTKADAPDTAAFQQATAAAVTEAFGDDWTIDTVRDRQPELAAAMQSNVRYALQNAEGEAGGVRKAIETVRERSFFGGRAQTGDLFDAAMRVRLGLLRAARTQDTATCAHYLTSALLPGDVAVPEAVRAQERKLGRALAERGLLAPPQREPPHSARVPGALVETVMAATKLSQARVAKAMQGQGSDADRCAVGIALLQTTLDWRGDGRRAILLTL